MLIQRERQGVAAGLLLIVVIALHLSVANWLAANNQDKPAPLKPVVVEVELLAAPPKPAIVTPPAPEPPKPAPPPKVMPPKPKPAPAKPKPKPQPVIKQAVQPKLAQADIKLPEPIAAPPKIDTPPLPVAPPPAPAAPSKVVDNAVRTAKTGERATCISCPQPSYPAVAKRRNWQGSVKLRLRLGSDGSVDEVTVVDSSGHEPLDEAAIEGAKKWRFVEGSAGVIREATQVINFRLEN
jgi:protein TonB